MQADLLPVEGELAADQPASADYSSTRPAVRGLAPGPEGESRSAIRLQGVDATPTVGGVTAPLRPRASHRGLAAAIGAGVAGVAALGLYLALGGSSGSGPKAAATDVAGDAGSGVVVAAEVSGSEAAAAKAVSDAADEAVVVAAVEGPAVVPDAGAPPSDVILVVRGVPRGAVVRAGDVALAGDPPTGLVPRSESPLRVTVEARGYEAYSVEILPVEDRELEVSLRRLAGPPRDAGRPEVGGAAIPTVVPDPF
jgi:hypothetical protein